MKVRTRASSSFAQLGSRLSAALVAKTPVKNEDRDHKKFEAKDTVYHVRPPNANVSQQFLVVMLKTTVHGLGT